MPRALCASRTAKSLVGPENFRALRSSGLTFSSAGGEIWLDGPIRLSGASLDQAVLFLSLKTGTVLQIRVRDGALIESADQGGDQLTRTSSRFHRPGDAEFLFKLMALHPNDPLLAVTILSYGRKENLDDSLFDQILNIIKQLEPAPRPKGWLAASGRIAMAYRLHQRQRDSEAEQLLAPLMAIQPDNMMAVSIFAQIRFKTHGRSAAREVLRQYFAQADQKAAAYHEKSNLQWTAHSLSSYADSFGDTTEAKYWSERAEQIKQAHPALRNERQEALDWARKSETRKAIDLLEGIHQKSASEQIAADLALLYLNRNVRDLDLALDWATLADQSENPYPLNDFALCYLLRHASPARRNPQLALEHCKKSAEAA